MSVDRETHIMRFLMGLLVLAIGLLLAYGIVIIGVVGWLAIVAMVGGAIALYLAGTLVIAIMDRRDR